MNEEIDTNALPMDCATLEGWDNKYIIYILTWSKI